MVFALTQIFSIFSLFLAFSKAIAQNDTLWSRTVLSSCQFMGTLGLLLIITGFTFTIDDGYKSLKEVPRQLRETLLFITETAHRQTVENIALAIEKTEPFNGMGFFSITRGTLTGMLSIAVTYIIILVQFRII